MLLSLQIPTVGSTPCPTSVCSSSSPYSKQHEALCPLEQPNTSSKGQKSIPCPLFSCSSAYQPPVEMCRSFPSSQGMARDAPITYQRPISEQCLQFPPQGFKQEFHDPRYEQAGSSCQYPAAVVVKQEQVDYMYDSGGQRELLLTVALVWVSQVHG